MSEQSKYGAIETPATATAAATPKRRGLIIALCLCTGGALFAVAGPGASPRLRGAQIRLHGLVNGESVPVDCPSGITDSYDNCVDEGCSSWHDGCNTCNVGTDGALGCTRMFCEEPGAGKCMDKPQIVGGPGDDDHDCCGGGSACGWGWCEAQGKCTQVWECEPDPTIEVGNATTLPAPATTPGVVNYFDTVAKQANTDCNGGEGVGIGCASGTTLSTENEYSGSGETTGEAVKHSTTATTVEGANAADKPSTKAPIINTAGGVASQSATNAGGETVHTGPGTATVRDGAGNAKYIPGRK